MLRVLSGIVTLVLLSACASQPAASGDRLLGGWTCELTLGELSGRAQITYEAGGAASGTISFRGRSEGADIALAGAVRSTWAFLETGRLQETVTQLTIASASINGVALAQEMMSALVQPIASGIEGQSTLSDVEFGPGKMILVSEDGAASVCSR